MYCIYAYKCMYIPELLRSSEESIRGLMIAHRSKFEVTLDLISFLPSFRPVPYYSLYSFLYTYIYIWI